MQGVEIQKYAWPDEFIKHGTVDQIEKIYGLDSFDITEKIIKIECHLILKLVLYMKDLLNK